MMTTRFWCVMRVAAIACCYGVMAVGCQSETTIDTASIPAEGTHPHSAEVPWEQQVRDLQGGRSVKVQFMQTPVTEDQLRMLVDGGDGLRALEINQERISDGALDAIFDALPHLEQLKLTGPVSDDLLERIAAIETLTALNLPQGEFDDEALRSLDGHPSLELLRFHSTRVTNEGLGALTTIPQLRFLHLIAVPINNAGLKHIEGMRNLESFYLDGSDCTEEGLTQLLQQLPDLHFHWNELHLPDDLHRDHH